MSVFLPWVVRSKQQKGIVIPQDIIYMIENDCPSVFTLTQTITKGAIWDLLYFLQLS